MAKISNSASLKAMFLHMARFTQPLKIIKRVVVRIAIYMITLKWPTIPALFTFSNKLCRFFGKSCGILVSLPKIFSIDRISFQPKSDVFIFSSSFFGSPFRVFLHFVIPFSIKFFKLIGMKIVVSADTNLLVFRNTIMTDFLRSGRRFVDGMTENTSFFSIVGVHHDGIIYS